MCKSDLPVGNNLHDDLYVVLPFKFKPSNFPCKSPLQDLSDLIIRKKGKFTNIGILELQAFLNTKNRTDYPDYIVQHLWFHRNTMDHIAFLEGLELKNNLKKELAPLIETHDMAFLLVGLIHAKSRGTVRLSSKSYDDPPILEPNYLSEEYDIETLSNAVKQQIDLTKTKSFSKYGGEFVKLSLCQNYKFGSKEYLKCYIRQMSIPGSHMGGTVKMGPDSDKESVVDPELKVRGIKKLRVVDGSILPTRISANTNAACIMIGERGADFIKADQKKGKNCGCKD